MGLLACLGWRVMEHAARAVGDLLFQMVNFSEETVKRASESVKFVLDTVNGMWMDIAQEEIFGPVLVMIPYDSEEEAIQIANDTPYGLAGYVQSEDLDHARQVASRIRAGNVHINGASPGMDVPFGGYKQSGNGREWGAHGFTDYLEIKAISGFEAA